jgi:drug/metabolite transporter (DMT)-like permease
MERHRISGESFSRGARGLSVHLLPRSGFALALLANLIWGTSFLASKVTLTVWGPFTASALRFAVAIVGMLLVLPALGLPIQIPHSRRVWLKVVLVGLTGFGLLYPLQLAGMTWIPSSLSASIMLTSPLFVLVFASGLFGEPLPANKSIAIALGIVGGTILVSPGNIATTIWSVSTLPNLIKGFLLTLAASLSLAASVIVTRSVSKEFDSRSLTFWSMCVGEAMLLPMALLEKHHPPQVGASMFAAVMALIFLALVCSVLAFLIWNQALVVASPQEIASTMHIKTPVAVLVGILFAGEPPTLAIITGTAMISFAVWLSQWKPAPRVKTAEART